MKKIKLTKGYEAIVDDEDFEYLNQWKWCYLNTGYAARAERINKKRGKFLLMHRIINDTPKGFETDHINRSKLDNRKGNLRTATKQQNAINTGIRRTNTSGHKGVSWMKSFGKWEAYLWKDYKKIKLGYFNNLSDAVSARKKGELQYHAI